MRHFLFGLARALSALIPAILLTACTTSPKAPVNFLQLNEVVVPLPGAKGKTVEDQRKIDRVIAASCSSGVLGTDQCNLHTRASAERRAELRN